MAFKVIDRLRARWARTDPVKLVLVAALVGVGVGLMGLGGSAAGLAWSNTESFCTSCHTMRDTVFAEFKGTIHDQNRTGVRATCPDCHVPHALGPKLVAKVKAATELYAEIVGKVDTKAKFEAHRAEMAHRVWALMKRTDSRECRHCHSTVGVSTDLQSAKAQARHAKGKVEGKTCIDCHFGIAHKEPDGPGPQELAAAVH